MSQVNLLFGETFFMNGTEGTVLLVICIVAALLTAVAVALAITVAVRLKRRKAAPVRELTDLTVDASAAACNFTVGGEFVCEGLQIVANYTLEPRAETLAEYKVVTEEELAQLEAAGEANDCYVVRPSLAAAGRDLVTVKYRGKIAYYTVSVSEPVQEAQTPPEQAEQAEPEETPEAVPGAPAEETAEESAAVPAAIPEVPAAVFAGSGVRFNKSFAAKLIQSSDEVKTWYAELKNELLSYKKVRSRRSWKRESYRFGRQNVVRFSFRGKTLCAYFALDPNGFEGTKYKVEPVEDSASYAETPCLYRIKNGRRVQYAKDVIAMVMESVGAERNGEYALEDIRIPYEETETLIAEGLIKVMGDSPRRSVPQEAAEEAAATELPESADGVEISAEEVPEETPAEEPAEEETAEETSTDEPAEEAEVEELSVQELDDVQSYQEAERDEDGIEVVGVMFRRRGKKVYWFDPDGKTWEKGEIALYITPDDPPQEVIVVDNAKISPSKLHLPLKPLHKAPRRPQTPRG